MQMNVIMPSNRLPEQIIHVLESYKHQSYSDFVISIIIEGEIQSLRDLCEKLELHNVRLFSVPKGINNASISRNIGLNNALDDEIIIFSDDDMLVSPEFIASHAEIHKNNDYAIVRGLRYQKDKNGCFYLTAWERDAVKRWNQAKRKDLWAHFVTSNASVSNRLLKQSGYFDENFVKSGCEDTDLALRLLKVGGKPISNEKSVNFHLSNDDMQMKFHDRISNFKYLKSKYPDNSAVKMFVKLTLLAIERNQINQIFLRNSEGNLK